MRKYEDITGNTYGNWTVLEKSNERSKNSGKSILWKCICVCGTERLIRTSDLKYGKTKGCLACVSLAKNSSENILYKRYIYNANIRHIDFAINYDFFLRLINEPCYYCNRDRVNKLTRRNRTGYSLYYNGIDRLDSARGYTVDNCVACCGDCNIAKNDMDLPEFLNLVKLIYNNRKI